MNIFFIKIKWVFIFSLHGLYAFGQSPFTSDSSFVRFDQVMVETHSRLPASKNLTLKYQYLLSSKDFLLIKEKNESEGYITFRVEVKSLADQLLIVSENKERITTHKGTIEDYIFTKNILLPPGKQNVKLAVSFGLGYAPEQFFPLGEKQVSFQMPEFRWMIFNLEEGRITDTVMGQSWDPFGKRAKAPDPIWYIEVEDQLRGSKVIEDNTFTPLTFSKSFEMYKGEQKIKVRAFDRDTEIFGLNKDDLIGEFEFWANGQSDKKTKLDLKYIKNISYSWKIIPAYNGTILTLIGERDSYLGDLYGKIYTYSGAHPKPGKELRFILDFPRDFDNFFIAPKFLNTEAGKEIFKTKDKKLKVSIFVPYQYRMKKETTLYLEGRDHETAFRVLPTAQLEIADNRAEIKTVRLNLYKLKHKKNWNPIATIYLNGQYVKTVALDLDQPKPIELTGHPKDKWVIKVCRFSCDDAEPAENASFWKGSIEDLYNREDRQLKMPKAKGIKKIIFNVK